jgi:hypothetical protein
MKYELVHDVNCDNPLVYNDEVRIAYRAGARTRIGNEPTTEDGFDNLEERIKRGDVVAVKVWYYQNSGTALKATSIDDGAPGYPFTCMWDAGVSGFAYVTKATALAWQGGKRLTKAKRARVEESLKIIVDEYGKWLDGDCWGYRILKKVERRELDSDDGDDDDDDDDDDDSMWEEVSSCYGFIGYDYAEQRAKEALKRAQKT